MCAAVLKHCSRSIYSQRKNECLQCSLCTKHGVSQRASTVKGYLILRKDANIEVLMLLMCESEWDFNWTKGDQ